MPSGDRLLLNEGVVSEECVVYLEHLFFLNFKCYKITAQLAVSLCVSGMLNR